jgi:hypothetical protein
MKTQVAIIVLLACAVTLTLASLVMAGKGDAGNPGVIPPHTSTNSHTYAEWSALWWQWTMGIPFEINPVLNPSGEFCDVDQDGPIWFLAGHLFSGMYKRYCTIPTGREVKTVKRK